MKVLPDDAAIRQAASDEDIKTARRLFREYEGWLGLDLCFQDFDGELDGLPGRYAPPEGRLYLAFAAGEPAGCIALRKIADEVCEMKRLYVCERARGLGLGSALIYKVIDEARAIGYSKMRLDTYPPKMKKAVRLYSENGFYEIPPYYENPYNGVLYLELDLRAKK